MLVTIPTSVGDLIDRITILQLKLERISVPSIKASILHELDLLTKICQDLGVPCPLDLYEELVIVNTKIWDAENTMRQGGHSDEEYLRTAQKICRANDRRAALKRQISQLAGSTISEEKLYQ